MSDEGPAFFRVDDVPWPDKEPAHTPNQLVEEARRLGAKRKFLARGEGGFHSQVSEFPAGYTVPMHSHDHNEMIVILKGGCTMLGGGPSLKAGDSVILIANLAYGFQSGDAGMTFMTIRTGAASTRVV